MQKKLIVGALCFFTMMQPVSADAFFGRKINASTMNIVAIVVVCALVGFGYIAARNRFRGAPRYSNVRSPEILVPAEPSSTTKLPEKSPKEQFFEKLQKAESNDCSEVRKLFNDNPSFMNAQDPQGKNWIMHAIEQKLPGRIVQPFLHTSLSLNCRDVQGKTPLHYAVTHDRIDLFCHVIAKGCSVNAQDKAGRTPLMTAILDGRDASARELLEYPELDVMMYDFGNKTSLYYAVLMQKPELVTTILQKYPAGQDLLHETNLAYETGGAFSNIFDNYHAQVAEFASQ